MIQPSRVAILALSLLPALALAQPPQPGGEAARLSQEIRVLQGQVEHLRQQLANQDQLVQHRIDTAVARAMTNLVADRAGAGLQPAPRVSVGRPTTMPAMSLSVVESTPAPVAQPRFTGPETFTIFLSFREIDEAKTAAQRLGTFRNLGKAVVTPVDGNYAVYVGPYSSREAARADADRIQGVLHIPVRVRSRDGSLV